MVAASKMHKRPLAEIVSTQTPAAFAEAVSRAAALLRSGELVAIPTETVYGLAANALDGRAVAAIYRAKGRPAHNPIIVHVADLEMARRCVKEWPSGASHLARAFWPGPLTMVLPRSNQIPDVVTAGGETVGVRWPGHAFTQALIRACGFPLAAPSANLSNRVSPTTAEHVRRQLGDQVALIVDGGPATVGIESTVLDLTVSPYRILRPGMIHEESLTAVLGHGRVAGAPSLEACPEAELRSPGRLPRHYAPQARLLILRWENEAAMELKLREHQINPGRTWVLAHEVIPGGHNCLGVSVIPRDPAAFARALYAELHRADEAGASCILVESPPAGPHWGAIADRLARASQGI